MEDIDEVNHERSSCLIQTFAPRYRKSRKKNKGELLDEFTQMTGYNRSYAGYMLRHQGKRLAAILPQVAPILERERELNLSRETRRQLIQISAPTIDRVLVPVKKEKYQLKGRSGTKPGTLLKHQIPIKRFAE